MNTLNRLNFIDFGKSFAIISIVLFHYLFPYAKGFIVILIAAAIRSLAIARCELLAYGIRGLAFSGLTYLLTITSLSLTAAFAKPIINIGVSCILVILVFGALVWFTPALLGSRAHRMLTRFIPRLGTS